MRLVLCNMRRGSRDGVVAEFLRESQEIPPGASLMFFHLRSSIPSLLRTPAHHCSPSISAMASICTRCAIRLRRAADSANAHPMSRTLAPTPAVRNKGLPTFQPTSNPELDALLNDFRYKHFLPAVLEEPQWNLVFKSKNKNFLQENPQAVNIAGEEVQLEHLGGRGVMPNRKKQLSQVLRLLRNGEPGDWKTLPNLLRGLHMMGKDPPPRVRAKIIRLATVRGQFGIILKCLQIATHSGLTLGDPETLEATIWGLRQVADEQDWNEEATARAIKLANEVAEQLESEAHGTGKYVRKGDPRRSPFVLGVFLELAAVYAWRFKEGKDADGKVKVFAERLLFNIGEEDKVVSISMHNPPSFYH